MGYFTFIKRIKIFSILSVILPIMAFAICLFLFWFLGTFDLSSGIIDFKKKNLFIKWNHEITLDKFVQTGKPAEIAKVDGERTFINCPRFILDTYGVKKDGKEVLFNKGEMEIWGHDPYFFERIGAVALLYKRTNTISKNCIRNYPVLNNFLIKFPIIEKILINAKKNNDSGFSSIKNPFFYGEVSISRTARYFPANIFFKPLIILSSFFLFFYWLNNAFIFNLINLNSTKKYKGFLFFGLSSAIFLALHAIFLGVTVDNEFFKIFRRSVIILFIISEVTAQILLTRSLYINKFQLRKLINFTFLKIKVFFVSLVFVITIASFSILIFVESSTKFKHVLEWNYFVFLLLYYILSYFLWNEDKTLVHTPEGV